jgi:hypothetical protein
MEDEGLDQKSRMLRMYCGGYRWRVLADLTFAGSFVKAEFYKEVHSCFLEKFD